MKAINIKFLVFILPFMLINCKKLDEYTQFNLNYSENFSIPSSTGINLPINLFSPEITTNSEAEFAINDTRKDLVEEIKLTSLKIELISPTDQDFSFLKSIAIFINTDGLEEFEIVNNEAVQGENKNSISLTTSSLDLQAYIKKDKFTLRFKTITDEILTEEYQIKASAEFFVDAKILN